MAVLKPTPSGYFLWDYVPSRAVAIVAALLFLIGTLGVIWQSIRSRTKFAIPFIVGGLFQVGGYTTRAAAQDVTYALAPYIAQYLLILVAPALFAASIYMTLGRVIRSVRGGQHSPIRPDLLTRIFVWGDVVSFLIQITGGSLQSMQKFNRDIAQYIVLGGLLFQILIFGIFATVALIWHQRMSQKPKSAALLDPKVRWKSIMYMLYAVSVLIMLRSAFRVVEYGMGRDGYLLQHEWTMYVFDTVLMVIAVLVFAWWYPGLLLVDGTE